MAVYEDQYVIINIWTNSRNKALPGGSKIGHISITIPDTHISLWPEDTEPKGCGFFKGARGIFYPFISLLKQAYISMVTAFFICGHISVVVATISIVQ
jgi:hypothetical protein